MYWYAFYGILLCSVFVPRTYTPYGPLRCIVLLSTTYCYVYRLPTLSFSSYDSFCVLSVLSDFLLCCTIAFVFQWLLMCLLGVPCLSFVFEWMFNVSCVYKISFVWPWLFNLFHVSNVCVRLCSMICLLLFSKLFLNEFSKIQLRPTVSAVTWFVFVKFNIKLL